MAVLPLSPRDHRDDTHVALAGDWHGQTAWAQDKIRQLRGGPASLILHLGDFGIWKGNAASKYLRKVEAALAQADMDLHVTLGNHEDWSRVNELWENPKRIAADGSKLPIQITPHIQIFPRGHRFELNGVSFLSVGGAASIDFETRVRGGDWWPEEMISWDDVDAAVKAGFADVVLVHDTPRPPYCAPEVERILAVNPMGFSERGIAYSKLSQDRITALLEGVKPKLLAHGHMHVRGFRNFYFPDEAYRSTVLSVDKDYTAGNIEVLDLAAFKANDGYWPQGT